MDGVETASVAVTILFEVPLTGGGWGAGGKVVDT